MFRLAMPELTRSSIGPPRAVMAESALLWAYLLRVRARVAQKMKISGWWALSTPLGAGVFAAMMLTSAWKVLSGQGVTWKGRVYSNK